MTKEIDAGISLYDLNRANMGQLPVLTTKEELEGAKKVIRDFLEEDQFAFYYMLLNHENRYFTLFEFTHDVKSDGRRAEMAEDVIICMQNCDFNIIDVNHNEYGNALEVWVKHKETDAVHMYLLFPYDFGVIKY